MSGDDLDNALRWMQFADDDLAAAVTIHRDRHLPHRLTCFHCQQSVEKAIKASLIGNGIDFPRSHDLNLLRNLLPSDALIKKTFDDFSSLSSFAAEARYPGDYPDASEADAKEALAVAERVVQMARDELEKKDGNRKRQ